MHGFFNKWAFIPSKMFSCLCQRNSALPSESLPSKSTEIVRNEAYVLEFTSIALFSYLNVFKSWMISSPSSSRHLAMWILYFIFSMGLVSESNKFKVVGVTLIISFKLLGSGGLGRGVADLAPRILSVLFYSSATNQTSHGGSILIV